MFASGKFSVQTFRVVLFGCAFVCLLGAKGFPPHLPGTGEWGSSLHSGHWPQTTCTLICTSQMAGGHTRAATESREPPFPVFRLNLEPCQVAQSDGPRELSLPPCGVSCGHSGFLPLCLWLTHIFSLGPAPAGHLSIPFHPCEAPAQHLNSGFLPSCLLNVDT